MKAFSRDTSIYAASSSKHTQKYPVTPNCAQGTTNDKYADLTCQNRLTDHIFNRCLFLFSGGPENQPKCQDKTSRSAAFRLLGILSSKNESSFEELISMIENQVVSGNLSLSL